MPPPNIEEVDEKDVLVGLLPNKLVDAPNVGFPPKILEPLALPVVRLDPPNIDFVG